jgi:hypothetical protein
MVRMFREIPVFVLALMPALIWIVFALPIVYRLRGISLPLNPLKRRNVRLSADDSVLLKGIAGFGVSLAVFHLAGCYFRWTLYGRPIDRPTWQTVIDAVGIGVFSGIVFGLWEGFRDARESLNKQTPK